MTPSISHGFEEETPEAKARWFQSLSMDERIAYFCEWMDFMLELNPRIMDINNAKSIPKGARVLSKT